MEIVGVGQLEQRPAIFINGTPFTAIGTVSDLARNPETPSDIIVPASTARAIWGQPNRPAKMLIETRLGGAPVVGSQAALAVPPNNPTASPSSLHPTPARYATTSAPFLVLAAARIEPVEALRR